MKYKFYTKTDKVREHHIDALSCKQAYEQLKNDYQSHEISLSGWKNE